ncbi:unnamed protein product [Amoebophrya sp. A25]|nr:unnamed protein product [Amoebophrya sp. A25]|eukprot:GSA25T00014916001.1
MMFPDQDDELQFSAPSTLSVDDGADRDDAASATTGSTSLSCRGSPLDHDLPDPDHIHTSAAIHQTLTTTCSSDIFNVTRGRAVGTSGRLSTRGGGGGGEGDQQTLDVVELGVSDHAGRPVRRGSPTPTRSVVPSPSMGSPVPTRRSVTSSTVITSSPSFYHSRRTPQSGEKKTPRQTASSMKKMNTTTTLPHFSTSMHTIPKSPSSSSSSRRSLAEQLLTINKKKHDEVLCSSSSSKCVAPPTTCTTSGSASSSSCTTWQTQARQAGWLSPISSKKLADRFQTVIAKLEHQYSTIREELQDLNKEREAQARFKNANANKLVEYERTSPCSDLEAASGITSSCTTRAGQDVAMMHVPPSPLGGEAMPYSISVSSTSTRVTGLPPAGKFASSTAIEQQQQAAASSPVVVVPIVPPLGAGKESASARTTLHVPGSAKATPSTAFGTPVYTPLAHCRGLAAAYNTRGTTGTSSTNGSTGKSSRAPLVLPRRNEGQTSSTGKLVISPVAGAFRRPRKSSSKASLGGTNSSTIMSSPPPLSPTMQHLASGSSGGGATRQPAPGGSVNFNAITRGPHQKKQASRHQGSRKQLQALNKSATLPSAGGNASTRSAQFSHTLPTSSSPSTTSGGNNMASSPAWGSSRSLALLSKSLDFCRRSPTLTGSVGDNSASSPDQGSTAGDERILQPMNLLKEPSATTTSSGTRKIAHTPDEEEALDQLVSSSPGIGILASPTIVTAPRIRKSGSCTPGVVESNILSATGTSIAASIAAAASYASSSGLNSKGTTTRGKTRTPSFSDIHAALPKTHQHEQSFEVLDVVGVVNELQQHPALRSPSYGNGSSSSSSSKMLNNYGSYASNTSGGVLPPSTSSKLNPYISVVATPASGHRASLGGGGGGGGSIGHHARGSALQSSSSQGSSNASSSTGNHQIQNNYNNNMGGSLGRTLSSSSTSGGNNSSGSTSRLHQFLSSKYSPQSTVGQPGASTSGTSTTRTNSHHHYEHRHSFDGTTGRTSSSMTKQANKSSASGTTTAVGAARSAAASRSSLQQANAALSHFRQQQFTGPSFSTATTRNNSKTATPHGQQGVDIYSFQPKVRRGSHGSTGRGWSSFEKTR